jgi:hypothetical protein
VAVSKDFFRHLVMNRTYGFGDFPLYEGGHPLSAEVVSHGRHESTRYREEIPQEVTELSEERVYCGWMSGPKDAGVQIPSAKWWLALTRGALIRSHYSMDRRRPPVACHRTPTFCSPVGSKNR